MRGIISLFALVVFLLPALSADAADRYTVTGSGGNETITEHTVCREVTNDNAASIMVPTKTKPEWCSFIDNTPSNVTLAECGGGAADIYCWGYNVYGQLGDGTTTVRHSPSLVSGGHTWQSIIADESAYNTCGLTDGGAAYCWGNNAGGQVGDGTTTQRTSPALVSGGHTWQSIEGGSTHSCGITTGGTAYCWGSNSYGQVGDSTTTNRSSPALVPGGHTWQSIDFFIGDDYSYSNTCGLTTGGAAYCWGNNFHGKLGDGTTTDRHSPALVSGGYTWQSIKAQRQNTCGITIGGAAYCWGYNFAGTLGDGTTTDRHSPSLVSGGHTWTFISRGAMTACGITTGGNAYCWGANISGVLGDGTTSDRHSPTLVSGGHTWAYIKTDNLNTCGITTGGIAYCWGANGFGQLGDGTTTERHSPTLVAGGHTWKSFDFSIDPYGGETNTCGVTIGGEAYCWGNDYTGQLGDGTTTQRHSPTLVSGGHSWEKVETRIYGTCGKLEGSGGGGGTCP